MYIEFENQYHRIHTFQLRASRPWRMGSTIHHEDAKTRYLIANHVMPNQFLFDVNFEKRYLTSLPGMITSLSNRLLLVNNHFRKRYTILEPSMYLCIFYHSDEKL